MHFEIFKDYEMHFETLKYFKIRTPHLWAKQGPEQGFFPSERHHIDHHIEYKQADPPERTPGGLQAIPLPLHGLELPLCQRPLSLVWGSLSAS